MQGGRFPLHRQNGVSTTRNPGNLREIEPKIVYFSAKCQGRLNLTCLLALPSRLHHTFLSQGDHDAELSRSETTLLRRPFRRNFLAIGAFGAAWRSATCCGSKPRPAKTPPARQRPKRPS